VDTGAKDAGPIPAAPADGAAPAEDAEPPCELRVSGLTLIDLEDPQRMDVGETPTLNGGCYYGQVKFVFTPDDCGPQNGPTEKYRVTAVYSPHGDSIVERFGNQGSCPPGDGSFEDNQITPTFGLIIGTAGPRELTLTVELSLDGVKSMEAQFQYLIP
jgi:hypothetical protein